MKTSIFLLILVTTNAQTWASDSNMKSQNEVQNKVNFHLRKMQTVIDARETAARIQAYKIEKQNEDAQSELFQNAPSYGLGDEGRVNPLLSTEDLD